VGRPVGVSFGEVLGGAIFQYRGESWAVRLEAVLMLGLSMSFSLRVYRCLCGMKCRCRMVFPQSLLHITVSFVCAWGRMALEAWMLNGGRVAPPSRLLQCAVVWVCGPWLRGLLIEGEKGGGGGVAA
jgi:hypothetical protein